MNNEQNIYDIFAQTLKLQNEVIKVLAGSIAVMVLSIIIAIVLVLIFI